ncbi:MAG: prepilin-type N-terminal cleavage/methylation domain-containing protein [Candidatus Humimicrobiaceae bacterium]
MKWLYERLYRKEKGFTLIELLIVIIILAVLAGIAIPSYLTITNRAKRSATQAELASIAVALEMYNADNSKYPVAANFAAMVPILNGTNPVGTVYMKTIPTLDKWNVAYTYVSVSPGSTYTMTSTGNGTVITFTDGQMAP